MTKTNWDYSSHASSYDARADYSAKLIDRLLHQAGCAPSQPVADIGAGTGKLTKELVARKLAVCAIEPNDKMRKFGAKNVPSVKWIDGTAENTGLHDNSVTGAFFGSSFNVADQKETVKEAYRILSPNGIIACMWNHRDLDDPQQRAIEGVIKLNIPSYDYGTRRADPSEALVDGGFFHRVTALEDRFIAKLDAKAWVYGWRSHATLARQGNRALIESILDDISRVVGDREVIEVPYYTRCWWAISTNDAARKNSA